MEGLGAIKVERGGGRAALAAFDGAIPVLKAGDMVAVYPEGTRSPDGRLYRGRTGVARLAVAAGVPIIPVGMIGTDEGAADRPALPRPGAGKVTIKFGKPIHTAGRSDDRDVAARAHRRGDGRDPEAHRPGVRAPVRPAASRHRTRPVPSEERG